MLLRTFLRCLRLARDLLKRSFLRPAPVVMVDAGRRLGYRRKQGMRFRSSWGPGPFIIHPIDPSCNVARVSAMACGARWIRSSLRGDARGCQQGCRAHNST